MLRFPEFSEPWRDVRLGEVVEFSKGKGIAKSDITEGGATPCVRYGELYTDYGTVIDEPISRTDVSPSRLRISTGGEVIVPASGETAEDIATAAVVLRSGVALGGDLNILQTDHDGRFLASYLSGKKRLRLASLAQGNSVVHIYPAHLRSLHISFPTILEQRKIATFLGVVDQKIRQLERKKGLLEAYKKGCIQKLFSRDHRFKNDQGQDFPDWKKRRFADVFTWVRTNSLSREHLSFEAGTVQNIHYGDIHTKYKASFYQDAEEVPFIAPSAEPKNFSVEEYCQPGDVVIADASEDYSDIGKAVEIVQVRKRSLVAGLHTFIARPKPGGLVLGFSGYLLRSPAVRKQIMRIAQGISVLGLSKTSLGKIVLEIPHPDEQRKIADLLSALDKKIALVEQELGHARIFKKGLLQKMFV